MSHCHAKQHALTVTCVGHLGIQYGGRLMDFRLVLRDFLTLKMGGKQQTEHFYLP